MRPHHALILSCALLVTGCARDRQTAATRTVSDSIAQGAPRYAATDSADGTNYNASVAREADMLARFAGRVRRAGDTLYLYASNGDTVARTNSESVDDGQVQYLLHDYIADIDHFLVYGVFLEGDGFLLVDSRNGARTPVDVVPLLSPDRTRLITASMDMEAGYNATRIQIFQLTADSLALEWTTEPAYFAPWGPSDASWVDDHTIRFTKNVLEQSGNDVTYRQSPAELRWNGSTWVIHDL